MIHNFMPLGKKMLWINIFYEMENLIVCEAQINKKSLKYNLNLNKCQKIKSRSA